MNVIKMFLIIVYLCLLNTGCHGISQPIPSLNDTFVAVEPSFDVPVLNVTVVAGETAILPCSVEFLGDYKVVWTDQWSTLLTFDIKRIIDDDRISVERPYTKDWNLLIHDVSYSDKGRYTCQINTTPVKAKYVELVVLVRPHILENASSKNVVAKEGETVELVCNVTGVPPPTVYWSRRPLGQTIGSKELLEREGRIGPCTYNLQRFTAIPTLTPPPAKISLPSIDAIGMNGEILVIHNVSRYCDGIYECMAFNEVPPAVNREMKVEVEFPPEITLPTRRIGQTPGRETMLECVIVAFPLRESYWERNGRVIQTNSHKFRVELYEEEELHQITLSLRISNIELSDYGNYSCYARNKLGSDNETMILHDYRRPKVVRPNVIETTSPSTSAPPYPRGDTIGLGSYGERVPSASSQDLRGGGTRIVQSSFLVLIVASIHLRQFQLLPL